MVDCSRSRVLIGVCVGLGVALVAVVAVLVYRETTRESTDTTLNSNTVNKFYPGLFRSPADQRIYEQRFFENFIETRIPVNTTIDLNRGQCTFGCSGKLQSGGRRKRQIVHAVTHACCYSSVAFQPLTNHTNTAGTMRTFLQFPDLQQLFAIHSCSTITGCSGCTCSQESSLVMAVVLKPGVTEPDDVSDTELDYFFFDGCCKCIS